MMSLTNLSRWRPVWRSLLCVAVFLPLFSLIHFSAYWLRFEGQLAGQPWDHFFSTVTWAVAIKLGLFCVFRLDEGWSRYVTFHDLMMLVKAVTASSLLLVLVVHLLRLDVVLPRSVILMDWGLTVVFVGGLRSASRLYNENARPAFALCGQTPVFIIGTNDSGEAYLRAIRRNPQLHYRVVGFLSEESSTVPSRIDGIPVIGRWDQMCQLVVRYQVSQVLLAAGDLPGQKVRAIMEAARRENITVTMLPSYEQLIQGKMALRPRQVSIEDLLRRDPVRLDVSELHRWLNGQVLLVTGSAGSIGAEICRQLLQFSPKQLIAVDRSETGQFHLERELRQRSPGANIEICLADLNDLSRMRSLLAHHRPTIIFHAAAYKHVPLMEKHPGEAVKNITLATCQLAELGEAYNVASFVMISTDKAVNPTSVMGACKRLAELYIQARAEQSPCQFVTVRFGNVLDSAGSVVPLFREQIVAGGPITVTHPDMQRFFMTIPEASQLVIQAGAMGRGGEIFVLDMGEPVCITDLARDLVRLSGLKLDEDIALVYTGIRPGEKLYEELHCHGERHLATRHPKILIAESENKTELEVLERHLRSLKQRVDGPSSEILRTLCDVVSQNKLGSEGGHTDEPPRTLWPRILGAATEPMPPNRGPDGVQFDRSESGARRGSTERRAA